MEFIKTTYSKEEAEQEKKRLVEKFSSLKSGYSLIDVNVCLTNGMSAYVTVLKDGETKDFVFRISNHQNGNRGISEGTLNVQCQGENISDMYYYYGDLTKKEARLSFLQEEIKNLKQGSASHKSVEAEIEKLMK